MNAMSRIRLRAVNRMTIPRPFIKWAGGKTALLPILMMYIPDDFSKYFEPFLGGGALFFALYREGLIKEAVLSDVNRELIDTYIAVRDHLDEVIAILDSYPYSREFYYRLRSMKPDTLSLPERAARFIYLNKTAYNGLYRVNRKGQFNVPFGRYKNPNYKDFENLRAVSRALRGVDLRCSSFEFVLDIAEPGDFIYFDPPYYPVSDTASFTQYTPDGFGREHQERLADIFRELSKRGVYVMLSNSDTRFIRSLYEGFRIIEIEAPRSINSNSQKRKGWRELLILSY